MPSQERREGRGGEKGTEVWSFSKQDGNDGAGDRGEGLGEGEEGKEGLFCMALYTQQQAGQRGRSCQNCAASKNANAEYSTV